MSTNDDLSAPLINAINKARAMAQIESRDSTITDALMRAVAYAVLSLGGEEAPHKNVDTQTGDRRLSIDMHVVMSMLGLVQPTVAQARNEATYGNEPSFFAFIKLATTYGLAYDHAHRVSTYVEAVGADTRPARLQWFLVVNTVATSPKEHRKLVHLYTKFTDLLSRLPALLAGFDVAGIDVIECDHDAEQYIIETMRTVANFDVHVNQYFSTANQYVKTFTLVPLHPRIRKLPRNRDSHPSGCMCARCRQLHIERVEDSMPIMECTCWNNVTCYNCRQKAAKLRRETLLATQ